MKMKIVVFVELLTAVVLSLLKTITGCGRTVHTMKPDLTNPPATTVDYGFREPCTPAETQKLGCLYGGVCKSVQIGSIRHTACECTEMFTGTRCEYFNPPESRNNFTARTANMAAGISVVLLLVFVIVLAVYVYIRWRRKLERLKNIEFEASAEELYRKPFSKRSSIVESLSRPSSLRRPGPSDREKESSYIQEKDSQHCSIEEETHAPLNGGASNNYEMKELSGGIKMYPRTSQQET